MSITAYLASRYNRKAELRSYAADLTHIGIAVSATWLDASADDASANRRDQRAWAKQDLADIDRADVVVLISDTEPGRGGCQFEVGYAFAKGKPVLVVGDWANIFLSLPSFDHVEDWGDALVTLYDMAYSQKEDVA